jgi:hypothetical protein
MPPVATKSRRLDSNCSYSGSRPGDIFFDKQGICRNNIRLQRNQSDCQGRPAALFAVDATKVAGLQFKDFSGNGIKQVAAGSQVSVQAIINSGCDVADYPATVLLEVRDSDGITKYLAFQQIALEPSQWSKISFSWVPDKPGNYDVRTFVMTCIACSGLNPVTMHRISVY